MALARKHRSKVSELVLDDGRVVSLQREKLEAIVEHYKGLWTETGDANEELIVEVTDEEILAAMKSMGKDKCPGDELRRGITWLLRIPESSGAFKYLGVPMDGKRLKSAKFNELVESFQSNLSSWSFPKLTGAGRVTLIKGGESGGSAPGWERERGKRERGREACATKGESCKQGKTRADTELKFRKACDVACLGELDLISSSPSLSTLPFHPISPLFLRSHLLIHLSSPISSFPLFDFDHNSHCVVYSTTPKLYHRCRAPSVSTSMNSVAIDSLSIHSSSSPEPFITASISSLTIVGGGEAELRLENVMLEKHFLNEIVLYAILAL
ncbi:hypothetical protein Droror1_Dr00024349 [Drosera rotundifolia]